MSNLDVPKANQCTNFDVKSGLKVSYICARITFRYAKVAEIPFIYENLGNIHLTNTIFR